MKGSSDMTAVLGSSHPTFLSQSEMGLAQFIHRISSFWSLRSWTSVGMGKLRTQHACLWLNVNLETRHSILSLLLGKFYSYPEQLGSGNLRRPDVNKCKLPGLWYQRKVSNKPESQKQNKRKQKSTTNLHQKPSCYFFPSLIIKTYF